MGEGPGQRAEAEARAAREQKVDLDALAFLDFVDLVDLFDF